MWCCWSFLKTVAPSLKQKIFTEGETVNVSNMESGCQQGQAPREVVTMVWVWLPGATTGQFLLSGPVVIKAINLRVAQQSSPVADAEWLPVLCWLIFTVPETSQWWCVGDSLTVTPRLARHCSTVVHQCERCCHYILLVRFQWLLVNSILHLDILN